MGQGDVRLGLAHPEGLAEPKGYWRYAEGMDVRRTYDFMGDNARPCRWPTLTRLPSGRLQWPTPDSTVRIARYSARRCEGLSMGDERPWQILANYQDLANYKVPRMIMVLDELPHSSASKIVRRELQELVEPDEGTP